MHSCERMMIFEYTFHENIIITKVNVEKNKMR